MKERMVNQGVKLTIALKTLLEDEAAKRGITSSSLVRLIVENFFNPEANKKEDQKLRQMFADALKIILATRGRGPMSTEMASSLVDLLFLSEES